MLPKWKCFVNDTFWQNIKHPPTHTYIPHIYIHVYIFIASKHGPCRVLYHGVIFGKHISLLTASVWKFWLLFTINSFCLKVLAIVHQSLGTYGVKKSFQLADRVYYQWSIAVHCCRTSHINICCQPRRSYMICMSGPTYLANSLYYYIGH